MSEKSDVKEENDRLVFTCGEICVTVGRERGEILSVRRGAKEYLTAPVVISAMRAPVDNDAGVIEEFRRIGVYEAKPYLTAYEADGKFTARGAYFTDFRRSILDFAFTVALFEGGLILSLDYELPEYVHRLPCVGFRFAANADMLTYFAYGGRETYPDMTAAKRGLFREAVSKQYFHYVKPQESGAHTGARMVRAEGCMEICSAEPFDFSVLNYSPEMLMAARHDDELVPSNTAYFFLGRQEGMGSNSCGPELGEKYRLPRKGHLEFAIKLL